MIPEDEDGFSFVDKRRTSPDEAPPEPATKAVEGAPESPSTNEVDEPDTSQLHHLTGCDRLLMCVDILQQGAWIAMGLRADPITQSVEADLSEARKLIDCVEYLAEKVRADLDDDTQRDLRNLVRDLQVNYVQQVNR
jgi:hypothetical protein